MRYFHRKFTFFLLISLSLFLTFSCEMRRDEESEIEDIAFKAKIDSAWAEVSNYWKLRREDKATDTENPQRTFAEQFFQYYLSRPTTKTGKRALTSAFMMWGNIGEVEQVEKAIPQIDIHSDVWPQIIYGIENAYGRNNRDVDFIKLLHNLENELTHAKSKTALFDLLGDYYLGNDDNKQAKEYFKKVVSMDIDSFYVEQARGNLYEIDSLNVGQIAPDFSAIDLSGNRITLSELRGKVVLLDFWATWCGPCIPEIPHLRKIQRDHPLHDFQIIGISLDKKIENLNKFIEKEKMEWPQIFEEKKWQGKIVRLYNVNAIPSTYLIDRDGKIASKNLRKEELELAVKQLLNSS